MNLDEMSNNELADLLTEVLAEINGRWFEAQKRVDELEMPEEDEEKAWEFSNVNTEKKRIELCENDFQALETGCTYIDIPGEHDVAAMRGWVVFLQEHAYSKGLRVSTGFCEEAGRLCRDEALKLLVERGMPRNGLEHAPLTRIWLR